jgi:hypothetical protein
VRSEQLISTQFNIKRKTQVQAENKQRINTKIKTISCIRPYLLSECSLIVRLECNKTITKQQGLLDDNSTVEPPEPISNSEVKRSRADGSVGFPHVRVGHRQALILKIPNS